MFRSPGLISNKHQLKPYDNDSSSEVRQRRVPRTMFGDHYLGQAGTSGSISS